MDPVPVALGGAAHHQSPGSAEGESRGEDRHEVEAVAALDSGRHVRVAGGVGVEDGDKLLRIGRDAADEVVMARAGAGHEACERVGGAVEGGVADVLAAVRAAADFGEEGGGVLPRGLADGLVDEERDEFVDGLAGVGQNGAAAGQVRGEAGAGLGRVRVEAVLPAVFGVLLGIEESDGRVDALGREGPEQALDVAEVVGVVVVVVEGEAAVAAHGREVPGVGEQADGAGDLAAQRAAPVGGAGPVGSGVVLPWHGSP